jgi:hypothetical protein
MKLQAQFVSCGVAKVRWMWPMCKYSCKGRILDWPAQAALAPRSELTSKRSLKAIAGHQDHQNTQEV